MTPDPYLLGLVVGFASGVLVYHVGLPLWLSRKPITRLAALTEAVAYCARFRLPRFRLGSRHGRHLARRRIWPFPARRGRSEARDLRQLPAPALEGLRPAEARHALRAGPAERKPW